jgi:hypothetical protein
LHKLKAKTVILLQYPVLAPKYTGDKNDKEKGIATLPCSLALVMMNCDRQCSWLFLSIQTSFADMFVLERIEGLQGNFFSPQMIARRV